VPPTAALELYTVTYDRDGEPEAAIVSAIDDNGCRHFATSRDTEVIAALVGDDRIGATIHLAAGDGGPPVVTKIE
jgi:acetyl-CoA C-acetyltransferase